MSTTDFFRYFMLFINDTEGRESFVFQADKPDEHYTLQIRHQERLLDLHKTRVLPGGVKTYETLFQISFFSLYRLFAKLRKEGRRLEAALGSMKDIERELGVRFVNPGWLRRNYMEAMTTDMEKLKALGLLRTKNRGRQVRLTKNPSGIDPEQLYQVIHSGMEPGQYALIKWNKGGSASFAGVVLMIPDVRVRFLLVSKKATNRITKKLAMLLFDEIKRLEGKGGKEVYARLWKSYPQLEKL